MSEIHDKAWKKTVLLMSNNICEKDLQNLCDYIHGLSEEECQCYIDIAQTWYDKKTLTKSRRIKVTANAVKLCLKLAEQNIKTFPYIEKIATKSWSTSGGTYSFSMPILTSGIFDTDIFSFGPVSELIKKNTVLDIGRGYHGALEVDFK